MRKRGVIANGGNLSLPDYSKHMTFHRSITKNIFSGLSLRHAILLVKNLAPVIRERLHIKWVKYVNKYIYFSIPFKKIFIFKYVNDIMYFSIPCMHYT